MKPQGTPVATEVAPPTPQSNAPASAGSVLEGAHLTRKETRQIVTPYAFFVSDELLGTPLAGPLRRGFGMLIDLIFISLLTQVSSLVLAAVAAWTFFRAGNRLKTKKRFNAARIFLRLLVALLLFVVAVGIVDSINDNSSSDTLFSDKANENDSTVGGIEIVALTAKYLLETKGIKQQVEQGECLPAYDCVKDLGEELVQEIVEIGLDKDAVDGALEGFLAAVAESLPPEKHTQLTEHFNQYLQNIEFSEDQPTLPRGIADELQPVLDNPLAKPESTLDKLESLSDEFGLGLGWATFYFSIFTAWWKGQTPGKKILGMKVIKLDNQPLNLWESFGRYGGYAAGLATGLMGFMQVFWDPNRQAIQDKISETLVLDTRKPKVPFIKEQAA